MSKQRKKIHCICKGKDHRTVHGPDRQRHISQCPIVKKAER